MIIRYKPIAGRLNCYYAYIKHEGQDIYLAETFHMGAFFHCEICNSRFYNRHYSGIIKQSEIPNSRVHLLEHYLKGDFNIKDFIKRLP